MDWCETDLTTTARAASLAPTKRLPADSVRGRQGYASFCRTELFRLVETGDLDQAKADATASPRESFTLCQRLLARERPSEGGLPKESVFSIVSFVASFEVSRGRLRKTS